MPVDYSVDGQIATITLDGIGTTNAFTSDFVIELDRRLADFETDSARAGVLRGAGAHFSSGEDLDDLVTLAEESVNRPLLAWQFNYPNAFDPPPPWIAYRSLFARRTVKPIVAAVVGQCYNSALVLLALHTDVRIAGETARFGLPGVRRGVYGGQAAASRLINQIPPPVLHWMLETGEPIDAAAALRANLVNEVVPDDQVYKRACELAGSAGQIAPLKMRAEKLALIEYWLADYESGLLAATALAALADDAS